MPNFVFNWMQMIYEYNVPYENKLMKSDGVPSNSTL